MFLFISRTSSLSESDLILALDQLNFYLNDSKFENNPINNGILFSQVN
jgi:hypothetical protein